MCQYLNHVTLNDQFLAISALHRENLEYVFPNCTLLLWTEYEENFQKDVILDILFLRPPSLSQIEDLVYEFIMFFPTIGTKACSKVSLIGLLKNVPLIRS
ncbi:hypothetical protein CDAR_60491 [Caerostris darwini]|uniref:Uncharacterized protein n=1 Tax=Caerostris darwini TaxID=1538125 RepID=A0AAV4WDC4_9ARAC|nr:hypothetical protein CDAR_60491 [Caerostris darwini]